jgi:hypothetical protein
MGYSGAVSDFSNIAIVVWLLASSKGLRPFISSTDIG